MYPAPSTVSPLSVSCTEGQGREREGTSGEQQGGEVERPLAEESGDQGMSCSHRHTLAV